MIVVLIVTIAAVSATVLLHLATLRKLAGVLARIDDRPVFAPLVMIFSLIAAHVAEIWLFAGAYGWLTGRAGVGALAGLTGDLSDYVYYSGVSYTTVGFGDIVPRGPIRLLTGTEALTGLLMIAWSASFTFLEMQRFWGRRT